MNSMIDMDSWDFFRTFIWIIACALWYFAGKKTQEYKDAKFFKKLQRDRLDEADARHKLWERINSNWQDSLNELQWAYGHLSKKNQKLFEKEFRDADKD